MTRRTVFEVRDINGKLIDVTRLATDAKGVALAMEYRANLYPLTEGYEIKVYAE